MHAYCKVQYFALKKMTKIPIQTISKYYVKMWLWNYKKIFLCKKSGYYVFDVSFIVTVINILFKLPIISGLKIIIQSNIFVIFL